MAKFILRDCIVIEYASFHIWIYLFIWTFHDLACFDDVPNVTLFTQPHHTHKHTHSCEYFVNFTVKHVREGRHVWSIARFPLRSEFA